MKKIYLILTVLFYSTAIFSQDTEYKTIFGAKKNDFTGSGGFDMAVYSLGGSAGLGTGGSGGIILNKQVILGGYGESISIEKKYEINQYDYSYISMTHGGLWFGYIYKGDFPVHPSAGTRIGWGSVTLDDKFQNSFDDPIFVLIPSLELELNVTRFLRISFSGLYQFTFGINMFDDLNNKDFSGPGGRISFKFGWF